MPKKSKRAKAVAEPVAAKRGPYETGAKEPAEPYLFNTIRQWRIHRGMTQEDLEEVSGLSKGSISDLEQMKVGYSAESLAALAKALNTAPAALLSIDPLAGPTGEMWDWWAEAEPVQRNAVAAFAKTMKTATR